MKFHEFYMIFTKIYIDFHQNSSKFIKNSSNHRNMFEIVPGIPIIILKQPPPPIVPLPHLVKAVKLGSGPKNRKIALKGGIFELPAITPKQKSRLKKETDP